MRKYLTNPRSIVKGVLFTLLLCTNIFITASTSLAQIQVGTVDASAISTETISIKGITLLLPIGWQTTPPLQSPLSESTLPLDTEIVQFQELSAGYSLQVHADWYDLPTSRVFGKFEIAPTTQYSETLVKTASGELVQVLESKLPASTPNSLLMRAAFHTERANYAIYLYGNQITPFVRSIFHALISSIQDRPETLPASSFTNDSPPGTVEKSGNTRTRTAQLQIINAAAAVAYDRNAAAQYAITYGPLFANDDNCYLYSNLDCQDTGVGAFIADGAHFANRAATVGGLPVPALFNQEAINPPPLRAWLLANGGIEIPNASDLLPGDFVFFGNSTAVSCGIWGWVGIVVNKDANGPFINLHSYNYVNKRISQIEAGTTSCGKTNVLSYVHIDSTQDAPTPLIRTSLSANPTTPFVGQPVKVTFEVCNYGPAAAFDANLLYVNTTPATANFPTVDPPALGAGNPGGCYAYDQTAEPLTTSGNYVLRAGYNDPFTPLVAIAGQLSEIPIYVAAVDEIQVQGDLTASPAELEQNSTMNVQFTAHNTGSSTLTDRFRVVVFNEQGTLITTFPESGDQTLAAGGSWAYNNTLAMATPGIFRVQGEHYAGSNWRPVYGNSVKYVRVKYPTPDKPRLAKGKPNYIAFAGEPVNTSTGNFIHQHTDFVFPLPGMALDITRFYNHLDAANKVGDFGNGWNWSLGMRVDFQADKTAIVTHADGQEAYFVGSMNSAAPYDLSGDYVGQSGETGKLTRANDGSATLTMNDQMVYSFDSSGQLARVRNAMGAGFDLVRNGSHIQQIVHTSGAIFVVTYIGSTINAIYLPDGKVLNYIYTGSDLTRADQASVDHISYTYDAQHRMVTVHDSADKQILLNEFDPINRVSAQTDAFGVRTTFTYPTGGTTVHQDAVGIPMTYTYDSNLRVIAIQDARGGATSFEYDAQYNLTKKVDAMGGIWQWSYDAVGRLTSQTNPLDATWYYTYDERGNKLSEKNPLGQLRSWVYDDNNHPIQEIDAEGAIYQRTFDSQGRLLTETDPTGAVKSYAYDNLGLPVHIMDAEGNVSQIGYDALGNRSVYTDALGNVLRETHNALGRMTRSMGPDGRTIDFTYDGMGNLLSETDGMGNTRTYTYDANDSLVAKTDFAGNIWHYGYDPLKRLISETTPLGAVVTYSYDPVGNLVVKQDERGGVTRYQYDLNSRLVAETDPAGYQTYYGYDAAGQRVSVNRPCESCLGGRAVEQTTYDLAGRVSSKQDGRGFTTTYTYDKVGRLLTESDPLNLAAHYVYNQRGDLLQIIDKAGFSSYRAYDKLQRVITETDRLGNQVVHSYDVVGNLIGERDARGNLRTWQYDAASRTIAETDALGNHKRYEYDLRGKVLVEYDELNRKTSYRYDINGRMVARTNPRNFSEFRQYDALGNLLVFTDTIGAVSRNTYNAAGDLLSETDAEGNTTHYQYDTRGLKLTVSDARGAVTHFGYDGLGRTIAMTDSLGVSTLTTYDANGNKTTETRAIPVGGSLADGQTHSYSYDELNRLKNETDALGNTTSYQYDALGRSVKVTGVRGDITQNEYDAEGRVLKTTDPLGNATEYAYDAVGNRTVTTDALSFATKTDYDPLNRPYQVTDALGGVMNVAFDAVGNRLAVTDTRGSVTHYEYDANNNLLRTIDALNGSSEQRFDGADRQIGSKDALDHWRYTAYDRNGRVISTTNALGNVTQLKLDANGNVIQETDALGRSTRFGYDLRNQRILITDTMGAVAQIFYNAAGNATRQIDRRGNSTTSEFDKLNRPSVLIDPLGERTLTAYDAAGNVISRTDQAGNVTTFTYDLLNRMTEMRDPLGNRTTYAYDTVGNQVLKRDARNTPTCTTFDGLRRKKRIIIGESNCATDSATFPTTTYDYDTAGNVIQWRDANQHANTLRYDALNRLVAETNPLGITWVYTYNSVGLLVARLDGNGDLVQMEYDAENRLSKTSYPNGTSSEFRYNAVGNRIAMRDWNGNWSYDYDALNRPSQSQTSDGQTLRYTFDAESNRDTLTYPGQQVMGSSYNARNELIRLSDFFSQTIDYQYDDRGLPLRQANANGTDTRLQFDASGRLLTIVSGQYEERAANIIYLPLITKAQTSAAAVAGAEQTTLDQTTLGQTTLASQVSVPFNGDDALALVRLQNAFTYTLDAVGNRINTAETRFGFHESSQLLTPITLFGSSSQPETMNRAYSYDFQNRLIKSSTTLPIIGVVQPLNYSFDAVGNRISKTGNELTPDPLSPGFQLSPKIANESNSYNDANQLLSTQRTDANNTNSITNYEYDRNGNRVRQVLFTGGVLTRLSSMSYDYDNRLLQLNVQENANGAIQSTQVVSYTYDGLGRRIAEASLRNTLNPSVTHTRTVHYLYDGMKLIGSTIDDSQEGRTEFFYLRANGNVVQIVRNGVRYWTQLDGSGSIMALTDVNGAVVDARLFGDYGEWLRGAVEATPLSYTGQEYDPASGNYHFLYRDFDPTSGLWTTQDPYRGDLYDPVINHRYQYVRNNPATGVDPLGLFDYQTGSVMAGDTWATIAAQWGTTADALRGLNPWVVAPRVGDYLQLPECNNAQCQFALGIREVRVAGLNGTECGERIQNYRSHILANQKIMTGSLQAVQKINAFGQNTRLPGLQIPENVLNVYHGSPVNKRNECKNSIVSFLFSMIGVSLCSYEESENTIEYYPTDIAALWKGLRTKKLFSRDLIPQTLKEIGTPIGPSIKPLAKVDFDFDISPIIALKLGLDGTIQGSLSICAKGWLEGRAGATITGNGLLKVDIYGLLSGELRFCMQYQTDKGFSSYGEIELRVGGGARVYMELDARIAGARAGVRAELTLNGTNRFSEDTAQLQYRNLSFRQWDVAGEFRLAAFYGWKYWGKDWEDHDFYLFSQRISLGELMF